MIRTLNVAAFAAMVAVNILANALPLNGQTTGAISDRYPVLFTPAGYVFAIWGVIYLCLAAFVVYQARVHEWDVYAGRIGHLFILSCALNSAWIFAWHFDLLALSTLIIVGLLLTLISLYLRLAPPPDGQVLAWQERWLVKAPFSLYLGWISVATIANVSILLYSAGWQRWGLSDVTWTVTMMVVAAVLAIVMGKREGDFIFVLVVAWALAGIGVRHDAVAEIAFVAWVLAGILAVLVLVLRMRRQSV
ncbi:MAG: tryptophan-rich sensory protein [Thermaerobacterales bacterium]